MIYNLNSLDGLRNLDCLTFKYERIKHGMKNKMNSFIDLVRNGFINVP